MEAKRYCVKNLGVVDNLLAIAFAGFTEVFICLNYGNLGNLERGATTSQRQPG